MGQLAPIAFQVLRCPAHKNSFAWSNRLSFPAHTACACRHPAKRDKHVRLQIAPRREPGFFAEVLEWTWTTAVSPQPCLTLKSTRLCQHCSPQSSERDLTGLGTGTRARHGSRISLRVDHL